MTDTPAVEPVETESEQQAVRMAKRERLLAEGDAYPVGVKVTHTIPQVREEWGHLEADEATDATVAIAGRVVFARNTGKLCFATLQAGDGTRIQVMISLAEVGEESLERWKELVDLGDIVQVEGQVISSKRGELSVLAASWQVASKALLPLPNLYEGVELSDETRVRQRYLDLITRERARVNVRTRSAINASVRQTLTSHGFLEIETPMLQTMHGGASARPFVTHSNDLDMDLFLRIAPELYLKRAVVGGVDRVFEINRNFRNEGVDATHNPEFAMLEAYQAYGDYVTIGDLTKEMVQNAALVVAGSHLVTLVDGTTFDFGGEWPSISMYESLSTAVGVEVTPQASLGELEKLADAAGVEVKIPTHGKYVEELWEHYVAESILDRPTFVRDFPVDTSPLVRDHRSIPGVVEKWDLYVRGVELATGYSELVDPVIQRQRFIDQAKLGARGDVEAMRLDEDFLRAMEHGMPPMGGMGMGIDRLMVALTGLGGIRDTILFPLVK